MKNTRIRELRKEETYILEDMLYEAIFQHEGFAPLPRTVIYEPRIYAYIDNFRSKKDDCYLVAIIDDKIIGAAWIRILDKPIKGYGNIDHQTPEFAISLHKDFRNKGLGTLLMKTMITHMKEKGYKQTSLSVDKNNYAAKMYKKLGFEIIGENNHDYLMLLKLE